MTAVWPWDISQLPPQMLAKHFFMEMLPSCTFPETISDIDTEQSLHIKGLRRA